MNKTLLTLTAALALAAAACTKDNTTAATTTTTSARTTDTFTGTVRVNGSDAHSFPLSQSGLVEVTLTAAAPPSTIAIEVAIGAPNEASTCVPFAGASANVQAGSAVQLSGVVSAGTICVLVRDIGSQTAPVTYTITVTHP